MRVLVLDRPEDCRDYRAYCEDASIELEFRDADSLIGTAEANSPAEFGKIDGVVSFQEEPQVAVDLVADRAGLPHRCAETVRCLTDKSLFKAHPATQPYLTPHVEIPDTSTADEALAAAETAVGFPLVLKPSNGYYSAGVVRVDDPRQFADAYRATRRVCGLLRISRGRSAVLAERYIDGDEFAVDGFVEDGRFRPLLFSRKRPPLVGPYFHETGGVAESFDPERGREMAALVEDVIDGIGLDCSPVHAELRRDRSGRVFLLEVAPRLSGTGTTMQHQLGICTGLDAYRILHGLGRTAIDYTPTRRRVGLEYWPAPTRTGVLRGVDQAASVCENLGAVSVRTHASDGQFVAAPPVSFDTILTAFFACRSVPAAERLLARLQHDCVIETAQLAPVQAT